MESIHLLYLYLFDFLPMSSKSNQMGGISFMAMHKYTLTLPLLLVKPHPQQTLHIVMNGHFLPLHWASSHHFYLLRKVVLLMCSSGFDAKPVAQNACLPLLCRKHRRVLRFRVGSVDPSHREAGRCTSLWFGSSHSLWKQILRRRRTTVQVDTAINETQLQFQNACCLSQGC